VGMLVVEWWINKKVFKEEEWEQTTPLLGA
jgi:hypothetical protein